MSNGDHYLNLLRERENIPQESDWERELRETGENISNALWNIPTDLNRAWQATQASTVDLLKSVGGEKFADFLTGDYDDFMEKKYDKLIELESKRKYTGGIVKGIREGDFSDTAGGVFNAITSLITTMGPALLTRGLSLVPQIAAPMITDYNIEKARTLYKGSDDPMRDLINNDEVDFALPATLGLFAAAMERIGIKGITKYIATQSFKGKGAAMLLYTGLREGTTESGQYFAEQLNTNLAKGMDKSEAAWEAFKAVGSDEGLESFLQGIVGGVTVGGVSNKVNRALRNDGHGQKLVAKSLRDIVELNKRKSLEKSPTAGKILDSKIAEAESNLKTYLINNQKIGSLLSNEQKTELEKLIDKKDDIRSQMKDLKSEHDNKEILTPKYKRLVNDLAKQYETVNGEITKIKNTVNLTQYETQKKAIDEGAKKSGDDVQEINDDKFIELYNKNASEKQKSQATAEVAVENTAGFYTDGTLYINKDRALELGAINVAGHELLHPVFNKLIGDDAAQGKIVEDFKKQLTEEDRVTMEEEMASRNYTAEQGNYNTEYINVFSDSITEGLVKFNDGVFAKIGDVITGVLKNVGFKNIHFESGRGVHNFLKSYHKGLDTGKFDENVLTLLETTKGMKDQVHGIQTSQTPRASVLQTINDLVPATVKTKQEFQKREIFNPIYAATQGDGAISNYVRSRTDSREAANKAIESVQDRLLNFDPAAIRKDATNKNPITFGEFIFANTNFGKLDAKKALAIEAKRKGPSLDTAEARQVVAEETKKPKPQPKIKKPFKKIDPLKFEKTVEKAAGEENVLTKAVDIKPENLTLLTAKKISDEYGGKVASKIFDVPEGKITDPKKNLTYAKKISKDGIPTQSEAGNIQEFYRVGQNAENFIKILPPTNVSSDQAVINEVGEIIEVSRHVLGYSLGLTNRVKNYFYTKTGKRSKGLTSQVAVWELKDKFINPTKEVVDQFRLDLGITPVGKLNNYNRSVGQLLKGVARLQGANTANIIARQKALDLKARTAKPINQILADMKAGFPGIMFSQGKRTGSISINNTLKKLQKEYADGLIRDGHTKKSAERDAKKMYGPLSKTSKNDRDDYIDWIANKLGKVVPWQLINAETFGNARKSSKLKIPKNLTKEEKAKFIEDHVEARRAKSGLYLNSVQRENVRNKVKAMQKKEGITFGSETEVENMVLAQQSKRSWYYPEGWEKPQQKKRGSSFQSKTYQKTIENNYKGAELILDALAKMVKNDRSTIKFVGALLGTSARSTGHFLRQIAIPIGKQEGIGIRKTGKGKGTIIKGEGISEHTLPAAFVAEYLFDAVVNNDVTKRFPLIKDNYFQLGLLNESDNKLKDITGESGNVYDFSATPPAEFIAKVEEAIKNKDYKNFPNIFMRYTHPDVNNNNGGINLNSIVINGKTVPEMFGLKKLDPKKITPDIIKIQNDAIYDHLNNGTSKTNLRNTVDSQIQALKEQSTVRKMHSETFDKKVNSKMTIDEQLEVLDTYDKGIQQSRSYKTPTKGISVVDFDDTLVTSKSMVKYEIPEYVRSGAHLYGVFMGKIPAKGKLTPAEFAQRHAELEKRGAIFDYSEFTKVIGGKKGPFFNKAKALKEKFGNNDIFILSARPQEAAPAIQAFLKGVGLDIKLENIVGLENGTPQAKVNWIVKMAAKGYNNFLFADDQIKNVKAVKNALDILDVKGKYHEAKMQFSKSASKDFNKILEETKGIKAAARFSTAAAKTRGAKSLPWYKRWFIPPSAEDFTGLLYHFVSHGKKGEQQMEWFKKHLLDPFARGFKDINAAKQVISHEFNRLQKSFPKIKGKFKKDSGYNNFTNEQAIRVYLWKKHGIEVPGLSKRDGVALTKIVEKNPDMKAFADNLGKITKHPDGYVPPGEFWTSQTIGSDIVNLNQKINRNRFLKEFVENKELIFSKDNLNKIEAIYGTSFRESLEDILYRMENGTNRRFGKNKLVNSWSNWVNNSVGAIMFLNMRSAVLQTISSVNFINWSDNNPLKAGMALANFPQYAKDFAMIFNSPMLKQRRAGLQTDIQASELAAAAEGAKDKPGAIIAYILKKGFLPTKMADSFAIASGGATLYRNRLNTYVKQGLSQKDAQEKAWKDFQEISEATQQSARPDLISAQQAGPLGRLVLAFQNTPMQYTRLMKKAFLDLVNNRGDHKTNVSKIVYYGAVQNLIFNSLQSALFAMMFDDEEEEIDKKTGKPIDPYHKKKIRVMNRMSDTLLRGIGVYGAAVSTLKNMVIKFVEEEEKGYRADHAYTMIEGINLSPPIGSKARKIYNATQTYKFNRDEIKAKGFALDNPAYNAVGNVVSATTNIPLDRVSNKINNMKAALDKNNEAWQRIATALGWNTWDVGIEKEKFEKDRQKIKKENSWLSGKSSSWGKKWN